jgi:hypothetical protein
LFFSYVLFALGLWQETKAKVWGHQLGYKPSNGLWEQLICISFSSFWVNENLNDSFSINTTFHISSFCSVKFAI